MVSDISHVLFTVMDRLDTDSPLNDISRVVV